MNNVSAPVCLLFPPLVLPPVESVLLLIFLVSCAVLHPRRGGGGCCSFAGVAAGRTTPAIARCKESGRLIFHRCRQHSATRG